MGLFSVKQIIYLFIMQCLTPFVSRENDHKQISTVRKKDSMQESYVKQTNDFYGTKINRPK